MKSINCLQFSNRNMDKNVQISWNSQTYTNVSWTLDAFSTVWLFVCSPHTSFLIIKPAQTMSEWKTKLPVPRYRKKPEARKYTLAIKTTLWSVFIQVSDALRSTRGKFQLKMSYIIHHSTMMSFSYQTTHIRESTYRDTQEFWICNILLRCGRTLQNN